MAGQPFVEVTWYVIHGYSQPSQQKPGIHMGLSKKDMQRALLSNGMDLHDIYETHKIFENIILAEILLA